MRTYTAKELAEILKSEGDEEISVRKIRYYRQIGVLPELKIINNKNYFTDEHLNYLRAMRTMKKTGENLNTISNTLNTLDSENIYEIGSKMNYYSTDYLIHHETYQFNEDVSFIFSKKIEPDIKEKIIHEVSTILKGES